MQLQGLPLPSYAAAFAPQRYAEPSYAARMAAHNRVTFHLNMMPRKAARILEAIGDLFWIAFNVVFIESITPA